MEAARSAALAGHHVTLHEASESLGGQLRLARQSPTRAEVAKIIPFYERELERLGVDVRLGSEASVDEVAAAGADLVVLATGSVPRRDGFQTWRPAQPPDGWATIDPLTGHDVLTGAALGHRVLLLDEVGHYEAIDVAEYLVDRGHHVHHVTKYTALSANLEARWDMIGAAHMRRLLAGDYELATRSIVLEVGPSHAVFAPIDGQHRHQRIDDRQRRRALGQPAATRSRRHVCSRDCRSSESSAMPPDHGCSRPRSPRVRWPCGRSNRDGRSRPVCASARPAARSDGQRRNRRVYA